MPNLKSAKKELRKSKKRREKNLKVKTHLKNLSKISQRAIEEKEEKAKELVAQTLKALDKAAQKKIIKKNTRDRKKSKLQLKLNKVLADKK